MVEVSSNKGADAAPSATTNSESPKVIIPKTFAIELEKCLKLINRGVTQSETSYIQRALKEIPFLRNSFDSAVLVKSLIQFQTSANVEEKWKSSVDFAIESLGAMTDITSEEIKKGSPQPEAVIYVLTLVLTHFLDSKQLEKGLALGDRIVAFLPGLYRRTLDSVSANIYFFYSRFYELTSQAQAIRPTLLTALQTAMLNKSAESLATLINLLLRNYIQSKLYDQASKLAAKTVFPENASNNQIARYFYYMGNLEAIELNYSMSNQHLQDASRKVPINASTAGFQQSVHKLLVIVALLMGEIPERSLFKNPFLRRSLAPYLELVLTVRTGELATFQQVISKHKEKFLKDNLMSLVLRLRHNVIKAGIRSICLSYKRISLRDICIKLHLDSEEDAEYIISKAIKDGVVDAVIDHENGFIQTNELIDAYSTSKPQDMFNQRISFCLSLYNSTVKAMRFPDSLNPKNPDTVTALDRELGSTGSQDFFDDEYDDDDDGDGDLDDDNDGDMDDDMMDDL